MKKVSEKIGNLIIIDRSDPHEFDGICELCGKEDELRPYGPNYENICFDCGMKDEETTNKRMGELLFGDKPS